MGSIMDDWFGIEGGSSAPSAPAISTSITDWASQLPAIYQAQLQYAPQQAQQQVDIANQYALPLAQAYYNSQKAMYPTTLGLREQLSAMALTGMNQGLSQSEKDQYRSDLAGQLGTNVGSGIGSDYMSRNMLMQQQDRQDYYRNLALSTAGHQPLIQAQAVGTTDYMSNFTPSSAMNYNSQNYGNYANAYTGLQTNQNNLTNGMIGSVMAGFGQAMSSSKRYKDNVRLWA